MDKIYSRKRIQFPKRKPKKIKKWKVSIFMIFTGIILSIVSFVVAAYPIFVASCKTAAGSKANHIVNEEVQNLMNDYTYNDLVKIEKDAQGNVTLLQANTIVINQIIGKISQNIQTRIDHTPTIRVYINYGSVSGITILKNFGPKFEIELEAAGNTIAKVHSKFESTGVNQTLHRIFLDVNTSVSILTPIGSFGKEIEAEVLLTEAVIVGNVPETYYNLEGLNRSDALEVME